MNWAVVLSAWCLDFWHLGQHVNQAKDATFGPETQAGTQWAAKAMHEVKHAGNEPFWNQLVDWRASQRGTKRREADKLLNYVACRKEMIVYDECQRRGWRISSSTTESQCGAAPHRVKGPGERWDRDNAESVIALETLHQSNQWNQYWTTPAAEMN